MPTPPYAKVLMSVNGGGQQTGGLTVSGGDEIQLSAESISGWQQARWEIYGYPPDWPTPTGWDVDSDTNAIFSTDFTPDAITLEAAATRWGKWLVRLIVNGGFKNGVGPKYNEAGQLLSSDVIDTGDDGWQVLSPTLGLTDVAFAEEGQFGSYREWVLGIQLSLRNIDAASTGVGGITQLTSDVLAGPGAGVQVATVAGIRGRPVSASAPSTDDVYRWNGSAWAPYALATIAVTWASDLAGSSNANQYVAAISGNSGGGGAVPVLSTAYLTFGTNPAAAGKLRFPNNTQIGWRNAGNSGDIPIVVDSSNNLLIGDQTYVAAARLWASASVGMQAGSAGYLVHDGATLEASASTQTWKAVGGANVRAKLDTTFGIGTFGGDTVAGYFAGHIGPLTSNETTYAGVWLLGPGVSRTDSNASLESNGSGLIVNSPNSGSTIRFLHGSATESFQLSSAGGYAQFNVASVYFTENLTPIFSQTARTSDLAPHDLEIQAQPPYASATTFRAGGNVFVNIPANVGSPSPTHHGGFDVRYDNTNIVSMGEYSNSGNAYGAIWFGGASTSKSATNWAFLGASADTYFNAPSASMYFGVSANYYMRMTATDFVLGTNYSTPQYKFDWSTTAILHFTSDAVTARIQYDSSSASNPFHLGNTTGVNELVGGVATTTRSTSSSFTLDTTTTDNTVFLDTSGATKTITLPTPTNGRRFTIVDSTGSFATNNATLARHGSEKINGVAASLVLATAWGIYNVYSDGTDWFVS